MDKLIGIVFLTFIFLVPFNPASAGIEDLGQLYCAVVETNECAPGNGCQKSSAEDINITQFIKIDFQNRKVISVGETERKRESAFKNYKKANSRIIIQGSEEGRGWSAVIDEKTGKMSATIIEEGGGFVIFGACILD